MSNTKPWYMTTKQRKAMDKQFRTMLQHNHDNLLSLCNEREPECLKEIKRRQPDLSHDRALRVLALNKRINEANRRTEDLILAVDPRWQE